MKKIVLLIFLFYIGIGFSQKTEKQDVHTVLEINQVNAYPNPFKDKTTIYFNSDTNVAVTVTVQNILGKIVFSEKIMAKQGENNVDFYKNRLSEGIYVYTVATQNYKTSKRLVIK